MHKNTSYLLALVLAVGSALVAVPSHAQTGAENNQNIAVSSQSSISNESIVSKLKKSKAANQNEAIKISQSQSSSATANTEEPVRKNLLHSRIGWLSQ
ncbi:hypothetical protein Riv7116_4129 [Rivularia sp. PCC 7116]|uniref:hypothetical protein n=1 Tax=Rivularia sp. PCC 7116 TaxID=373994 RepID=UPI00029F0FA1|nr:hypothetical protein [Rivularia sp. PCC 7116]AFY56563.1 hypothetical protein Riv7116_4129 [Rivularia sp. PCC 7116]